MNQQNPFGEVIYSYTRADAIEDGVLVDVSKWAWEEGFKYPAAVTRAVWENYVAVPAGVECQDVRGRAHDILHMLLLKIRATWGPLDRVNFQLYVRNHNRERLDKRDLVNLYATVGPGDQGEPVITILEVGED